MVKGEINLELMLFIALNEASSNSWTLAEACTLTL